MFDKALSFGGWPGLILLFGGNALGVCAWLACVGMRRYRVALSVSILLFPFTFYAGRAAGLVAFSTPDFDQYVGPTTFLLLALFSVLLFTGRIRRAHGRLAGMIEFLLWCFAISLTVSQFMSHTPREAMLLSVGAAWQFVALYYLLTSLIVREAHLPALLNALFLFSLLNVLVRVVAKGEPLIVSLSSPSAGVSETFGAEAGRVGSGALGPAVSYAGYLAMLITLGLGVYFMTRKPIYLAYVAAILVELLNTFTRGGLFVMALLALLVLFRRTRRASLKVALPAVGAFAVVWPIVHAYIVFRGLALNVSEIGNFSLRVDLTRLFIESYRFDLWGKGILQPTMFELASWLVVPVHNVYLEVLDTCGVVAFGFLVLLSLLLIVAGFRATGGKRMAMAGCPSVRLAPFILIALLQWIVYANTTSTSILAYYPYEGTAVFWIVAFLPILCLRIRQRSARVKRFSPAHRSQSLTPNAKPMPVAVLRQKQAAAGK